KQQKVAQEKRHATASPLTSPVQGHPNSPREFPSSDVRLNHEIFSRAVLRVRPSGEQSWRRLPFKLHEVHSMSSRAEYYRRRGLEAEQRAAQATEVKIRDAFEDVAEGWFVLAEQSDWLERQHNDQQASKNR